MCGIAGILQYPSKVSREKRIKALRFLFPAILRSAESRGSDATGVYQVHADGDWTLLKKGQKASEWLPLRDSEEDPALFQDLVQTWGEHPEELKVLVGHCRKATVGSFGSSNLDNHPFAIQVDERNAILGVHNGTLSNHEKIFSNLAEMGSPLRREGKVDSEAIFHLLYHVSNGGATPWSGPDLHYTARRMDGSYAIIAVNSRFPNQVIVMRDDRPMESAIIAPYNFVVLASEKKFIEEAAEHFHTYQRFCDVDIPAIQIDYRTIPERDYRIFDLTKEIPEGKPDWKAHDSISIRGDLNTGPKAIPEVGWSNFSKSTTTATATTCSTAGKQYGPTPPATSTALVATTSKSTNPPPPPVTPTPQAEATKNEAGETAAIVAEIEVPESDSCSAEIAALALIEGRFLNLCPLFDSDLELATALGLTVADLQSRTRNNLANMVSEAAFCQGYALGLSDSRKAVEDIQLRSRGLTQRMEDIAEKKKSAQTKIWELRQLLVAREILSRLECERSPENIFLVLTKAMGLPTERAGEAMKIDERVMTATSVDKAEEMAIERLIPKMSVMLEAGTQEE